LTLAQTIIDAAEAGDTIAQCVLAGHYYAGKGVRRNIIEAEKWWRKAAEKGNAAAQYCLGFHCYKNMSVNEALSWIEQSANNGNHDAQMFLGTAYVWGGIVSRNRVIALKWLILGSESKSNFRWQPKIFCWIIKMSTKRSQLAQARKLADEWKSSFRVTHDTSLSSRLGVD
jgi:hypothetical protein